MESVFEFRDYKKYFLDLIASQPKEGRGFRKALAEAVGCQTAYISHVLNGNAHFSWEQAEAAGRFIGHSREELRYFLLMVEYTRAGTDSLRRFLSEQLDQLRETSRVIKKRINVRETLTREHQSTYYSAWYYAAIHVLLTIPEFQTRETIARHLSLSVHRVAEVLEFLVSVGLATKRGASFVIGTAQIHLERDSPLISKHHTNWRMKSVMAMEAADSTSERGEDLHYSAVFTLSEKDVTRIRAVLVEEIERVVKIVKTSKEEKAYALAADFFQI